MNELKGQKTYISFIFCTAAGDEIFGNFISITPLHFYLLKASWELVREVWWRDMKERSQLQLKSFPIEMHTEGNIITDHNMRKGLA